jgi:hypothetical protein
MNIPAPRPQDVMLGNIIAIVFTSFFSGIFFMQGFSSAAKGEQLLMWLFFLGCPLFAFVIFILGRRILRQLR